MQPGIYIILPLEQEFLSLHFSTSRFSPLNADKMLKAFSLATLLLYISSPCTDASASPISVAEKVYPEVIPGPGLPSLASLELTSAELYQSEDELSQLLLSSDQRICL